MNIRKRAAPGGVATAIAKGTTSPAISSTTPLRQSAQNAASSTRPGPITARVAAGIQRA